MLLEIRIVVTLGDVVTVREHEGASRALVIFFVDVCADGIQGFHL